MRHRHGTPGEVEGVAFQEGFDFGVAGTGERTGQRSDGVRSCAVGEVADMDDPQIRHHRAVAAFRDLKKRRISAGSDKTENFACRRSGARRFAAATNLSTNDRASRASLMQKFAVMLDVAIPIFLSFR